MTDLDETLRIVNQARAVIDLSPISALPKGHRFAPRFNPIARAFEGRLTVLDGTVVCNDLDLAARLATAWGLRNNSDGKVALPDSIRSFLRSFEGGHLSQFEISNCEATGCSRAVTQVRDGMPLCAKCAEEWQTLEFVLTIANSKSTSLVERSLRMAAVRVLFKVVHLLHAVTSIGRRIRFDLFRWICDRSHQDDASRNETDT